MMAEEDSVDTPLRSGDSSSDSSSESEEEQVQWLATGREKRSTAGNRLTSLIQQEGEDDDLELLFAEDEDDAGFSDAGDEGSDVQMDSSDDDEDHGPTAADNEELEGEKELQQQAKAERQAKKRKANDGIPAVFRKKVKIDPTAPLKATPPRPKKKSERMSWIPSLDEAPTRASARGTTQKSKEQLHAQMVDRENKRLKQLESMIRAAKKKDEQKPKELTQEDRLAEAARVEKKNAKSLNRWEEAEKIREEEQLAKLAALHNRKLEGPVITWWSGLAEFVGGKLRRVGKNITIEEKKEKDAEKGKESKKKRPADVNADLQDAQSVSMSAPAAIPTVALLSTPLEADRVEKVVAAVTSAHPATDAPSDTSTAKLLSAAKTPLQPNTGAVDSVPSTAEEASLIDKTSTTALPDGPEPLSALPADEPTSLAGLSASPSLSKSPQRESALPNPAPTAIQPGGTQELPKQATVVDGDSAKTVKQDGPQVLPKQPTVIEENLIGDGKPAKAVSGDPNLPAVSHLNGSLPLPGFIATPSLLGRHSHEPGVQTPLFVAQQLGGPQQQPGLPDPSHIPSQPPKLMPSQTTPFAFAPAEPQPNIPPVVEHGTRNCLILENFDETAIRSKDTQTQILFNRKFLKLPKSHPAVLCAITAYPAKFRDPATGLAYCNAYAYKEIQKLKRGDYRWSTLLQAYVGQTQYAARGVPPRFTKKTPQA